MSGVGTGKRVSSIEKGSHGVSEQAFTGREEYLRVRVPVPVRAPLRTPVIGTDRYVRSVAATIASIRFRSSRSFTSLLPFSFTYAHPSALRLCALAYGYVCARDCTHASPDERSRSRSESSNKFFRNAFPTGSNAFASREMRRTLPLCLPPVCFLPFSRDRTTSSSVYFPFRKK